jgi:hypothetical protein
METFWFYHEYLDEARRFRIHRVEATSEQEARKLHRHAAAFQWVTDHVQPTVSPLFHRSSGRQPDSRTRTPARRHLPDVRCTDRSTGLHSSATCRMEQPHT